MPDDSFRSLPDVLGRSMTPKAERPPAPYACCPRDGEPLVSTVEFPGAEFYCVVCRGTFGFLAPVPGDPTPERDARHEELREQYRRERAEREDATDA